MHGTLVAGLIAARTGNGLGLASTGVRVELMDLQVVSGDGSIQPGHEAAAIRWAADHGARVINLSLGALRDPRPKGTRGRTGDGFSATEAAAVRYAVARGVLVVAAVGNGMDGRAWSYADWPSALPHVFGVAAVDRARRPAAFSNRDATHVDISAPGAGVVSTVPVASAPSGLSVDAPGSGGLVDERGEIQGTSFATPQVSGAAALLLALRPDLTGSQAARLLVQTARDVHRRGRDRATGPGELDLAAAIARLVSGKDIPPGDDLEPNDDAGGQARPLPRDVRVVSASADRWDDSLDVYRVALKRGQALDASLRGPATADFDLLLFRPGGGSIAALDPRTTRRLVAGSSRSGATEHARFVAPRAGLYDLAVWAARGSGAYQLVVRR
jgi:subtilisin family serine protease